MNMAEAESRWLYNVLKDGMIEVYSVPGLDLVCRLQPSFTQWRCGIQGNTMYIAEAKKHIYMTTTQLETFQLPIGTKSPVEIWPKLNFGSIPLLFSDKELLDLGDKPQLVNLKTKAVRLILADFDTSMEGLTPCWHQNRTLMLFTNEKNHLRVYESPLGNYSHTRTIPRHVPGFYFSSLTAISISQTQVLVLAGRRTMQRGKRPAAYVLVYDTEMRFAEEAGKLPGGIRSVRSYAVYGRKLYLLMKEGNRMLVICDLETGMAVSIGLGDWSTVKGFLWGYKHRYSRLPEGIAQAITKQYLLGQDILPDSLP